MDKGKAEFSEIEEWMKDFLPDISADIRIVKDEGVSFPSSSGVSNSNQPNKTVAAMTPHGNSNMWQQHSLHRTSDSSNSSARQNVGASLLEGFSQNQTSANAVSDLRQHQLLQNQALEKMNRAQNIFQPSMQSNTYPCYPRQQHQQMTTPMVKHHQETFNALQHTDQTKFLKSFERQSGFHLPQKNNLTMNGQLRPGNHPQTTRLGPLQVSESTPRAGSTNTIDWVDIAYHKILQIKEMHLSDLTKIVNKSLEVKRLATTAEVLKKSQCIRESAERVIRFLNTPRHDISRCPKERLDRFIKDSEKFINVAKLWYINTPQLEAHASPQQMQQIVNHLQCNSKSSMNSFKTDASLIASSCQYSPMGPTQLWAPHQGNVAPSPHKGLGERSLGKLLHPSTSNNNNSYSNLGTSQQQIAMRNICNSLDYSASPTNKQQQDPSLRRQKMKQPVQQLRRFVGSNQKIGSPQNSLSATSPISSSPCALPSPSTPMADSAKSPLSSFLEESNKLSEISPSPAEPPLQDVNELPTDTQGLLLKSPFAEDEPVKRFVDVVKSISSGALTAALSEIKGIVNLNDTIGGQTVLGEPIKVIFRELADDIGNCVRGNPSLVNRTGMESRMKRHFEAIASDELSNDTEFRSSECDTTAKRQRNKHIDMLMEEINEINEKFIEVVVDVPKRGSAEGTLVRCSYIPAGFSRNIPNTSQFPNLLLELIVTADYPNSSPTVPESMPIGCSDEYMWMKAKSSFGLSLKKFSEPVSLKEMARAWDICARKVFHEFAEKTGGGNFSSRYGNWENCAVAAV